ncbi:MAG TPA: SUMF1/EgtB/PvdO family nonheme iron enzyme [Candidatus Binatia bacterium]|nr:SUMF1/EgtB/PvdO family nonheme iron enzyme [Candidatus Binatia bacterium]
MPPSPLAAERWTTLLAGLQAARAHTDGLFRAIHPGALFDRPIPERHRLVFYLGHLEAFDWNLLGRGALALEPLDAGFDQLFAFGIDPTNGKLPNDQPRDWPNETRVRAYNHKVRGRLDAALEDAAAVAAQPLVADGTLLHVAIEHRLMHAETLAYLLHQMPGERKTVPPDPPLRAAPPQPHAQQIPAGTATLGKPRTPQAGFGWDNEFEECTEQVPAFGIGAWPVTNAEFLKFVRAGGYAERGFWNDADWDWKEATALRHPHFWVPGGGGWKYRAMSGEIPLPQDAPVYVSHAEAAAYARWKGGNLPTEAQWHRAAFGTPQGNERAFPWGDAPPDSTRGNFDSLRWDATPVGAHPLGASAFGVHDLTGNGWEWTSTVFAPFPGFQPFPFYRGYSADFFDGKHYVMKGGSARTAAPLLRRSFRNWFQPHYPYIYAKFRIVED